VFFNDRLCRFAAAAAAGANAQGIAQVVEIASATVRGFADLRVSDGFAEANVHESGSLNKNDSR